MNVHPVRNMRLMRSKRFTSLKRPSDPHLSDCVQISNGFGATEHITQQQNHNNTLRKRFAFLRQRADQNIRWFVNIRCTRVDCVWIICRHRRNNRCPVRFFSKSIVRTTINVYLQSVAWRTNFWPRAKYTNPPTHLKLIFRVVYNLLKN
jgi:hypothetical protein